VESQIRTVQTYLELIIVRLSSGQSTALEALQQQQQMRALESQLPTIQASQQIAANRLAVLMGVTPSVLEVPALESLPAPVELPEAGVPADLLQMRPDVRAAQARAEAADWRVVTAICDRLPSFRLSGSLNMQAPSLLDLFDGIFWRLAASAAAPLIDGGRRRAAVERARLVREEALVNWGQTLLTAVVEVEDALVQQQGQRAYMDRLQLEHENATATLTAARDQYLNGVADYLRVLTAISALQQIELAQLQAQRTLLSQQVTLFRALGGDWVSEIGLSDRGEE
jgi:multidrug efflux system outer membrane protein